MAARIGVDNRCMTSWWMRCAVGAVSPEPKSAMGPIVCSVIGFMAYYYAGYHSLNVAWTSL